ncbi:hypothetical protein HZC32_02805 [Candidatus Woesearchaeota archaeon]|nr:hypothetical protein [Candidatus Woesearchaeota archaeon]
MNKLKLGLVAFGLAALFSQPLRAQEKAQDKQNSEKHEIAPVAVQSGEAKVTQQIYVAGDGTKTILTDANRDTVMENIRKSIFEEVKKATASARSQDMEQFLTIYRKTDEAKQLLVAPQSDGFSVCLDHNTNKVCDGNELWLVNPSDGSTTFKKFGKIITQVIPAVPGEINYQITDTTNLPVKENEKLEDKLGEHYAKKKGVTYRLGAGYVQLLGTEGLNTSSNLFGGKVYFAIQLANNSWYYGGELLLLKNSESNPEPVTQAATKGPLADSLKLQGSRNYSNAVRSIGGGAIIGNPALFAKWLGLELGVGITTDLFTKKMLENSAHYINGNLLEGTDISNATSDTSSQLNGYLKIGLPVKIYGSLCGSLEGGFRTNLRNRLDGLLGIGLGYCQPAQK